jgi:hypothetical protein
MATRTLFIASCKRIRGPAFFSVILQEKHRHFTYFKHSSKEYRDEWECYFKGPQPADGNRWMIKYRINVYPKETGKPRKAKKK